MSAIRRFAVCGQLALTTLLLPSIAFAHPMKSVGDFYAGMLHPVITLETVLPIIALSLLAGQQTRQSAICVLVVFPGTIVCGTLLVGPGHPPSLVGTLQLSLTAVFGILVALAQPLPRWLLTGLTGLLGVTVGWTNAAEITPGILSYRFVSGLAITGLVLIAYGIGLVRHLKVPWTQIAVRVVGSWTAAAGILVLGLK